MSDRGCMLGAAKYIQGHGILSDCGPTVAALGKKALIITGKTAWEKAGAVIASVLSHEKISFLRYINTGFCSRNQIHECIDLVKQNYSSIIIAVGGGKSMDLGKAVAAQIHVPIITVPTSAATCAAVTPFSVMYDDSGHPDGAIYHDQPVDLCLSDLDILSQAPIRTFKAGLVDAMAKLPELRSWSPLTEEETIFQSSAIVLAEYIWKSASTLCQSIIHEKSTHTKACAELSICVTGACSGYASGTKQLSIAHAFNSAVRQLNANVANHYLHGESVGVGILVQMAFNHQSKTAISQFQKMLKLLGMPYSASLFGVSPENIAYNINKRMNFQENSEQAERLIQSVRQFS